MPDVAAPDRLTPQNDVENGTWKGTDGEYACAVIDNEFAVYRFIDGEWRKLARREWHVHDDWYEPWCEDHPEGDNGHCLSCVGQSHDAWMHRAKQAEYYLRCARNALAESLHMAASTEDYKLHVESVKQLLEETEEL